MGLLWIFAWGLSEAGRPDMRRAISAMFRSTARRSRMRAGVTGSSRARPIICRALCSRSTRVTPSGRRPASRSQRSRPVGRLRNRLGSLGGDLTGLLEPVLPTAQLQHAENDDAESEPCEHE